MRPFNNNFTRLLLLAYVFAALCSCSEYLDRRDTISLGGGNAVATDKVTQMVDPWPRASANRNIAYNGEVMQHAYERYRTGRVTPPSGAGTSTAYQQSTPANDAPPAAPAATQPAAATK
jgi:hypothetical protein